MGSSASGKYAVPSVASGVDRELRVKVVHLGSNKQHNILLKVHFVQPAHAGAPATAVDLSSEALSAFFDLEADMALVEVPEDLRQLTEEMRELTLGCKVLSAVPEWLCEFAQLRLLCLTGYSNYGGTGGKEEPIFTQLPGIGSLAKLTTLDLNFLPRLTRMPPCFGQLTALTTLSLTSLYDLVRHTKCIFAPGVTHIHTKTQKTECVTLVMLRMIGLCVCVCLNRVCVCVCVHVCHIFRSCVQANLGVSTATYNPM